MEAGVDVDIQSSTKTTMLQRMLTTGNTKAIKCLLDLGANVHALHPYNQAGLVGQVGMMGNNP